MRRIAPFLLSLMLTACGEQYTPVDLYQAKTPDCKDWVDNSRFDLPKGITVSATAPAVLPDGGVEIGIVYMLPRGAQMQFTSRAFKMTQPKGAPLSNAEIVSIYRRGTEQRAEIVDVINELPIMMVGVGNSESTQYRFRLQFKGKVPERFDLTLPAMTISNERYPVRTYTYRYFEDRKAYGMCS